MRSLNGRDARFAVGTREKVRDAARELGYEPSVAGRALARGSSYVVIALIPNTTFGGNLQDVFERITDVLAAHGLTLVLRLSTPSTDSLGRLVAGLKPAAVLSLTPLSKAERAMLAERDVPVIDPVTSPREDHDRAIGALQARTLVEHGHTRLAFAHLRTCGRTRSAVVASRGFATCASTRVWPNRSSCGSASTRTRRTRRWTSSPSLDSPSPATTTTSR